MSHASANAQVEIAVLVLVAVEPVEQAGGQFSLDLAGLGPVPKIARLARVVDQVEKLPV